MLFYMWIKIYFVTGKGTFRFISEDVKNNTIEHNLWINLLYATDDDGIYLSYFTVQEKICKDDDFSCQSIFYELDFIGKLSFAIFALAFTISLYDAFKLIRYGCAELVTRSKFFQEKSLAFNYKNNFRSFTMIVTYIVGLTLNYFAMINMTKENIKDYTYGPSFWVFFSSLIAFALASIWENRKMSQIAQQELVIKLLENEKKMLR